MKKLTISRRGKAKRIWNKQKLKTMKEEAEHAEIRMLLRYLIEDKMDEGDLHGAIEYLEPWADGNNDRYHWPMVKLCVVHTLLGDVDKALKLITDVLYWYDACQLAQFYFAMVLFCRDQSNDAVEIWEAIVKQGAVKLTRAKCDCCEGLEWAENLVADCKCSLSLAYSKMGREKEAKYWNEQYEADCRRGRSGLLVWEEDGE